MTQISYSSDRLPFKNPATLISTVFGVGFIPFAPGTVASILTVPVAFGIAYQFGEGAVYIAALGVFFLGLLPSYIYARHKGDGDPSEVVIDEVAGQLLALSFADPDTWWHYALGFALFRLFDIVKIWPVNWAERFPGGWGIMLDDMVAGIYGAAITYGAIWGLNYYHVQQIIDGAG